MIQRSANQYKCYVTSSGYDVLCKVYKSPHFVYLVAQKLALVQKKIKETFLVYYYVFFTGVPIYVFSVKVTVYELLIKTHGTLSVSPALPWIWFVYSIGNL